MQKLADDQSKWVLLKVIKYILKTEIDINWVKSSNSFIDRQYRGFQNVFIICKK